MQMIERVARAIALQLVQDWTAEERGCVTPEEFVEMNWRDWEGTARAGIEAMPGPDVIERAAMKLRPMFSDEMSRRIAAELIYSALQESKETEG